MTDRTEAELADILFIYGEERASRRIARAIVKDREAEPFTTTLQLAGLIERLLPRKKPGQSHPATRSFQALRIAVNEEYDELIGGLEAAERALKPGGKLVLVEYRGEDPTVPIKRLHKMTVVQARKEMSALGFLWSKNIDVLPQQHLMIFVKPSDTDIVDQDLS